MHATNDDKLVLMAKSFVPSTDSVSHHNISAQDQVTAFLHVRLKQIPDASSLFETWLNSIMAASQKWNPGAWAGRMVLTTPNRNEYVILFRFKTHVLMQGWLTSAERCKWMVQLDSTGCSEQVGWDLQEGIVAFMPQSMVDVAWRCVSARDDMQDDYLPKQTRSEPPPKWKSALVVWLSLQLTVLPWDLSVAPSLNTMGLPLGWRILLTLLCIVPTLKLVLLPLLDRCCHCFLFGQRCPGVEPCLSLQIGCACCRHHSPKNDNKADDRVASLELYVQSTRRMQSAARRRLLERIERLELLERGRHNELGEVGEEKKMTTVAIGSAAHESIVLDVVSKSEIVANESTSLLDLVTKKQDGSDDRQNVDAKKTKESKESKESKVIKDFTQTQSSTTTMDENAWTVCIRYEVRQHCFVQFEEWVMEMARIAAKNSVGHRGCVIIERPRMGHDSSNVGRITHVVVFQYDTREHLQAWSQHSARNEMVARLQPLLEPKSMTSVHIFVYDSLTDITDHCQSRLMKSASPLKKSRVHQLASQQLAGPPMRQDPQAWKISLVIVLALFIVIWFVGVPVVGPWVGTWGVEDPILLQVVHTMVGTFVNVLFLTYLLMPILVLLAGPWLFAPWRESNWSVVRVLQRGFECWDTVGMKLREERGSGSRQ